MISRRSALELHGLLAVMLVFFGLFGLRSEEGKSVFSVCVFIATALGYMTGLVLFPTGWWSRPGGLALVLLSDLGLTTGGLYLTQGYQTDLYLAYFLVIFMAGLSASVAMSVWVATAAGAVYVASVMESLGWNATLTSLLLMRLPFFFVVALICAWFAQTVKQEQEARKEAGRLGRKFYRQAQEAGENLEQAHQQFEVVHEDWEEALKEKNLLRQRAIRLERQYHELWDRVHDPIILVDANEKVVRVNEAAHALFPQSPFGGVGAAFCGRIADPVLQATLSRQLHALGEDREPLVLTIPWNGAEGVVPVEWNFSRYVSRDGGAWVLAVGHLLSVLPNTSGQLI